jgi:hypothetical protein
MTSGALLRILARRWYMLLVGILVIAGAFVTMQRAGGAYTTQVSVIFVAPGNKGVGELKPGDLETLVDFAAVVEREYHHGTPTERLAENASLFGSGVDQGSQVLLPNSGTQWATSFARPALTVRVVGPSAGWVGARLQSILTRIDTIAAERQAAAGVAPKSLITTERTPLAARIDHIDSTLGTQLRALVALTIVGLGLSASAAVALDRALARLRREPSTATTTWPRARLQESRTP